MTSVPSPGWYPDPDVPGGQRYFDGVWTEHRVAAPGRPAPLPPTPEKIADRRRTRRVALIVAGCTLAFVAAASTVITLIPRSAADKRDAQLRKDCYALEAAAARAEAALGHTPTLSEQEAEYSRCIAVGGPSGMNP